MPTDGRFGTALRFLRSPIATAIDQAGGANRAKMIALLAATVALDSADKGAIGAVAVPLKHSLHIGNTALGLIVTVVSITGAVATIPVGMLTDRASRMKLLGSSLALWTVAMLFGGAAQSYLWLIVSRIGLAGVTATASPVVASLIGDLFLPVERGRIYGFVLAGELLGTGLGIVVAGEIAAIVNWRVALCTLALPAAWLAWHFLHLPEPGRGGKSRMEPQPGTTAAKEVEKGLSDEQEERVEAEREEGPEGHDLNSVPLWRAALYVLRVRTNVILIVASMVGYFFFTGLRTFAFVYVRGEYHLSQATATALVPVVGAGALVGVLISGRFADRLMRSGHPAARITVAAACPILAVVALAPAVFVPVMGLAFPLFIIGAFAIGASNPPMDAARLDVIHHAVWGRAEAIRTVLRTGGEAVAPLLFGYLSHRLAGGGTEGLRYTFAIMLVPLLASGAILLIARRTYPGDAAAVGSSRTPQRRLRRNATVSPQG